MNILKFGSVNLPTPDSMTYKEADLQSEGYRDEAGFMHKVTVRWGVRSLKVKWERPLTNAELTLIRNAVKTPSNRQEYQTVTYYCDTTGDSGTMIAYTADLDYNLSRVISNSDARWTGLSLSIIEQ